VTIKYAPDGTQQWARVYNGPYGHWDVGAAMALDPAGNPIVTGYSQTTDTGSTFVIDECTTVKYDPAGAET
jgi:hypothetical protein